MIGQKIDPVIKDIMIPIERIEINGHDCLYTLGDARNVKYVRAFNRVHRSTAINLARADPRSIFNPPCEIACWLK